MIEALNSLRGTGAAATLLKIVLSVFCGGIVGAEREFRQRPAGLRTHMLICVGSTMTMITSQFLAFEMHASADPGRLGAQVVAGIGFIGAGSIIVSKRNRVKGLTTAAGLWTVAIIGLAIGAGYYECALVATGCVLFIELIMKCLERWLRSKRQNVDLYIEYNGNGYLLKLVEMCREKHYDMTDLKIIRDANKKSARKIVLFSVRIRKNEEMDEIVSNVKAMDQTISVEVF